MRLQNLFAVMSMIASVEATAGGQADPKIFEFGVPASYTPIMTWEPDGSVSWNQPASSLWGYNGYCGHTAWANVTTMYTQRKYDPSYFYQFVPGGDWTPGLRPLTLQKGLNRVSHQYGYQWSLVHLDRVKAWSYLRRAVKGHYYGIEKTPFPETMQTAPLITLMQWSTVGYHWITVVNVVDGPTLHDSYALINEGGRQYRIYYNQFMELWGFEMTRNAVTRIVSEPMIAGRYTALLPYRL